MPSEEKLGRWGRVRHEVANGLEKWFVRSVAGPVITASAALHRTGGSKVASVTGGILLVAVGNRVESIRRKQEEVAHVIADAHRRITEILIDAVTVFEARRPSAEGRFRANVMLVDGDALRIAYRTSGYLEGEEQLHWRKGEGCVGYAWQTGLEQHAPTEDAPLPDQAEAHAPTRRWGMTPEQVLMTAHVRAIIAVPIPRDDDPSQLAAVFSLDDTLPPTGYGEPVFLAARGVASRVAQFLAYTGLKFPDPRADSPDAG